ncbi:MAG: 7-cyano-7-deazaguanine reductase [Deltaproteobacteria bacterium]|nr:7-cyano-7-deazaguanine reductase [Deltaproteobacteria bacterium]
MRSLTVADRRRVIDTLKQERIKREEQGRSELALLPNSHWSKAHLLRRIPNPTSEGYEQKIHIPEFTFMGVGSQPDFGEILLTFYPRDWTIELKSLKVYKEAFRSDIASYERLANVIYEDIMTVFEPCRLRLSVQMRPRGGISSVLTIDSDWAVRGGKEELSDWKSNVDTFGLQIHGTTRL